MTGQGPRGTLMMAYSPDRFVGEIDVHAKYSESSGHGLARDGGIGH